MSFVRTRYINGKGYAYLETRTRVGKKVKSHSHYLGKSVGGRQSGMHGNEWKHPSDGPDMNAKEFAARPEEVKAAPSSKGESGKTGGDKSGEAAKEPESAPATDSTDDSAE